MRIAKKLLCTVLSLCMIASTIVMPLSVKAADGDVVFEYTFNDGTTNQTSGSANAGAVITDSIKTESGELTVVDGVGGKAATDKVAMISRLAKADDYYTRITNSSTAVLANADSATVEVEIYVPAINTTNSSDDEDTADLAIQFFTNTVGLGDAVYGTIALGKWGVWTAKVTENGTDNATKYSNGAGATAGVWHKLAITATKASSESAADGSMKFYIDNALVNTVEGLQIDTFYPEVRMHSQWRNDFTADGTCKQYFDDLKMYEGVYVPVYREYDFSDASANDITNTEIADGLMGKDASDKVAHVTGGGASYNRGKYYAEDVVTAEAQVYLDNNSSSFHFYPGSNPNGEDRYGIDIQNGNVRWVNPKNGWTYTTITTVDKDMWHKLALTWDKTDNTAKYYCDGELIYTATDVVYHTAGINQDIRVESAGYFDNFRVYSGAYRGDAAITAASTANVTVSGTTLSALEGVTFDDLKAAITAYDQVKFYTDATLASETTDVNAANVMLVNYGELYKKYDLNITSPYGTKLVWNDMSTDGNADGLAGKAASDKVMMLTENYRPNSGQSYTGITSGQVSYEAKVYLTDGAKVSVAVLNNGAYSERGIVRLMDGKVYTRAAGDTYSNATNETSYKYEANTWNKVAIVKDATGWTFYLNGQQIATLADAALIANQYGKDFAIYDVSGTVYVDDYRVYTGDYRTLVDPAIADPASAVDGVITVEQNDTIADIKALVTDGTAEVYTDDTLTTPAASTDEAAYVLVTKGELYKTYKVKVKSAYDPDEVTGNILYFFDFNGSSMALTEGSEATGAFKDWKTNDVAYSYVGSIGGKLASDKALKIEHGAGAAQADLRPTTRSAMSTSATTITREYQLYVPEIDSANGSDINFGFYSNADGDGSSVRAVVTLSKTGTWTAKVYEKGVENATSWSRTDGTAAAGKWHRIAIEGTKATSTTSADGKYRMFLDGVLVCEVTGLQIDTFYKENRVTLSPADSADGSAVEYIDNIRAYEGDYAGWTGEKVRKVVLSTNFDTQSIVDGTNLAFAANATSAWFRGDAGSPVIGYSAGLGGKAATDYAAVVTYDEDDKNVRMQTGWGSANAKATDTIYTLEADAYMVSGTNNASIMFKMRNSAGANLQMTLPAPAVANRWYNLAITINTEAKTVKAYINGVDATDSLSYYGVTEFTKGSLTADGLDYVIISDQVNANFGAGSTTAVDNFTVYEGEYDGATAPSITTPAGVYEAGTTAADVITETGATYVVDTNGVKVENSAAVATGYQAVKVVNGMYSYATIEVEVAATDVVFSPLAVGTPYTGKDGVEYVFVAITTGTIADISLYDTFRVTDGTVVKEMALSELMGTTLTGAVEIGVLVMNVPYANINSAAAKLVLAD